MGHDTSNHRFAKAVAQQLYPAASTPQHNNVDMLWSVITDEEKQRCQNIADAVLDELLEPTPAMLKAADDKVRAVVAKLASPSEEDIPEDVLSGALKAMISAAR